MSDTPIPSPADVTKEELHLRRIEMRGFRRSDGLFEVEGRVIDKKPYDFSPISNGRFVPANEPIHNMGVRLIFDESMLVRAVETFTDAAPYSECPEGGRALQSMVGVSMTRGWSSEVRTRLGGSRSCTHLMELLIPLATAAIQSLSIVRAGRPERTDASGRPVRIDSCYAYRADGELVLRRWPNFHRPETHDD
jgi:hypothetical protein